MTDIEDLRLTDDEIVAIAALVGQKWTSRLPTVDVRSDAELAAATLRGWRSLTLRGLADADGRHLTEVIGSLYGVVPVIRSYVADAQIAELPSGNRSYFRRRPGGWTVEATTPIGVHLFRAVAEEDAVRLLEAAVEKVYVDGVGSAAEDGKSTGHYLCVGSQHGDQALLLTVCQGELKLYRAGETMVALSQPASAAEAVEALGIGVAAAAAGR
jgi:hypothetical protein